jgi:hypothetical protein
MYVAVRYSETCTNKLNISANRDLSTSTMPSKQNNYTDPDLRQEVKEEVQAGDKGGKPGQWSARKVLPPYLLTKHQPYTTSVLTCNRPN